MSDQQPGAGTERMHSDEPAEGVDPAADPDGEAPAAQASAQDPAEGPDDSSATDG